MNEIDIPILKKSYELYKTFHEYRKVVPKQDRFSIYQRSEEIILDIIEAFFKAGSKTSGKQVVLDEASAKLNTLRMLIRLMKDTKAFDTKKYTTLQGMIDEIGRMLGGWIRSTVQR
jgi:hypothetical protein